MPTTTTTLSLLNPSACAVSDRMIGVCLRTDEPASLTIDYGTDPDALVIGLLNLKAQ
jgi:hypothetical protein